MLTKHDAQREFVKYLSRQIKYTHYVNAISLRFLQKMSMQFIIANNPHQSYFSTLDDKVDNIYPARLMLLVILVALLLQKGRRSACMQIL